MTEHERVACIECGVVAFWTIQPCWRCRQDRLARRWLWKQRQESNRRIAEVGERAARGEIEPATDEEFDGL